MLHRRNVQICAIVLAVALSSVGLWAAKEFVMPHAENANSYALKDAHPKEKVTAAIELYNTSPKDQIFVAPYNQEGIMPVFLVISNDGNQPVSIKNMQAELVTTSRAKLLALTTDDIFRRVAHIQGSSTPAPRVGPLTLGGNKNKKAQKEYSEILAARFEAEAVEPHTTKSGFLFFDIEGVKQPVDGAHLYLTGINDAGGSELMYFDIPLGQ